MNPQRRAAVLALGSLAATSRKSLAAQDEVQRGRQLNFPRDHGAHLGAGIEWWYLTGWLGSFAAPLFGFQLTFFRSRTGLAQDSRSRFAAKHLLFAHAALTDVVAQRHHHAQAVQRWNGEAGAALGAAATTHTDVHLGHWFLRNQPAPGLVQAGNTLHALVDVEAEAEAAFKLDLRFQRSQPLLLQGLAGFSLKAPGDAHASHYYSEPQLLAQGNVTSQGRESKLAGRAWLDHEWSSGLLHPDAVGWDWIGMNLADGSALTAFRLRRQDGSVLWAGGSWRAPGTEARAFAPAEVRLEPGRTWASAVSQAVYPVQWQVHTPVGAFEVRALLDNQEMDARRSTGMLYWEGLAELLNPQGQRVGLGYLELTGYGQRLQL